MADRVYLDWNATAPLRPEARDAMIAAMDVVGNPSSVHAEGRAAKGIIETARGQVAELVGCEPSEIVFTSGATEAATAVIKLSSYPIISPIEHDCLWVHAEKIGCDKDCYRAFAVATDGIVAELDAEHTIWSNADLYCVQSANSETGVCQNWLNFLRSGQDRLVDATQSVFRLQENSGQIADFFIFSAHKMGGPKGIGALSVGEEASSKTERSPLIKGGGQEMGRRSGTENVIGIAGFGAAAVAAQRDLDNGEWERVAEMRDGMEEMILDAAPEVIVFGKDVPRLPNTSNFAVPHWKGETQVMQMDLAGFAVSAGSACSSGKVKASRVLKAMGFDDVTASSAIRVSMGPTTQQEDVTRFADVWIDHYRRFKRRAA